MPGKHKYSTISFRPNLRERAIIEKRALLSGMNKKDFIIQSCIHSKLIVDGNPENIKRVVDAIHDMRIDLKELARRIMSGEFLLPKDDLQELKSDFLAFILAAVDIADGASYLFEKEPPVIRRNRKVEKELLEMSYALGMDEDDKSISNQCKCWEKFTEDTDKND